ncbi:EF-hand domain-containing protein [Stenotrophomonas sp.]|uniref:EF-hand domain-containing protein n=1 Tax=Stenotrophomonas sp. TaxID=69392 RepID=UPI0028A1337A|nr:EF-hand domain-containing protein [Stenotrophomonas sp.]
MKTLLPCLCGFALLMSAAHAQQLATTAAERFATLDRNADGEVSKDEYDGTTLFQALDADHNNRVTVEEVQALLGPDRDGQLTAADRIRVADLNGDGELSDEEVRRVVEMRFQSLDVNHDEVLTLSELQSGFWRPN